MAPLAHTNGEFIHTQNEHLSPLSEALYNEHKRLSKLSAVKRYVQICEPDPAVPGASK